jgi:hypothetical protein
MHLRNLPKLSWRSIIVTGGLLSILVIIGGYLALAEKPVLSTLASCIAEHTDASSAYHFGETTAQYDTPRLSRWEGMSCPGGIQLVFSRSLRNEVSALAIPLLLTNPSFREGAYAGTAPPGISLKQRGRLGQLGLELERNAGAQREAVLCEKVELDAVAFVAQLDMPFAVAVIGIQLDIGDVGVAQSLADILLTKAQTMQALLPQPACSVSSKEAFLKYAGKMRQFAAGTHPWALGCSIDANSPELSLKCSGTKPPVPPPHV